MIIEEKLGKMVTSVILNGAKDLRDKGETKVRSEVEMIISNLFQHEDERSVIDLKNACSGLAILFGYMTLINDSAYDLSFQFLHKKKTKNLFDDLWRTFALEAFGTTPEMEKAISRNLIEGILESL